MEFRKNFDTIPEQFDKFRQRYSQELFDNLIDFSVPSNSITAFLISILFLFFGKN